jgi:NADH-quinone oxidoreductase subunit G
MVRDTDGAWSGIPAGGAGRGGPRAQRCAGRAGVLTGGRLTLEDAYAYAEVRQAGAAHQRHRLRARPESDEETAFLASRVAGAGLSPTYADLEQAPAVLLVGFEPEDESPIIFRGCARRRGSGRRCTLIAPPASCGLAKLSGTVLPVAPGGEAGPPDQLSDGIAQDPALSAAGTALAKPGAVILVGERAATSQGTLSSVVRLARATGTAVGWVPCRAGDRSALEAGALPTLLPGGRPVTDGAARAEAAEVWDVGADALPATPGRSTEDIISAAAAAGWRAADRRGRGRRPGGAGRGAVRD